MALLEGQVQVRDLIMGPGSDFIVMDFNPWVRNTRVDQAGSRAWNHGSWSGAEWAEEIVVPLVVAPQADSGHDVASWLALHQQLAAAFRPIGDATEDVEMRFCYGGKEYLMRGRPRMVEPEVENIRTGAVVSRCAFVAQDPFIYAGAPLAFGPFGLPEFSGGLVVPSSELVATNYVHDSSTNDGTVSPWSVYGTNASVDSVVEDGRRAIRAFTTALSTACGAQTSGLTSRPAGQQVTISAWVKNPVGSTSTSARIIGRDDANNDSAVLLNITSGALITTVPADGTWRRIHATGTVKDARNLTRIYFFKPDASLPAGEELFIRDAMINDGELIDFFDGDTPDGGGFIYDWTGTPHASTSTKSTSPGLSVPFTIPGTLTAGFADLTNDGTADTGLVLRIDGPAPFPFVTLKRADGTVQTLRIDVELGENDWLDIDTDPDRRTVLLNGTANFRGRVSGDWPILPPGGPSRLRWGAAEHSTGTLSGTAPIRWW